MDVWRDHLRLLSVFHLVVAGLGALVSLVPTIHVVVGVMVVRGDFASSAANPVPTALGWAFVALGIAVIVFGLAYSALLALAG